MYEPTKIPSLLKVWATVAWRTVALLSVKIAQVKCQNILCNNVWDLSKRGAEPIDMIYNEAEFIVIWMLQL